MLTDLKKQQVLNFCKRGSRGTSILVFTRALISQQSKLEAEESKLRAQLKTLDEEVALTSAAYVPSSQSQAALLLPTQQEREAAAEAEAVFGVPLAATDVDDDDDVEDEGCDGESSSDTFGASPVAGTVADSDATLQDAEEKRREAVDEAEVLNIDNDEASHAVRLASLRLSNSSDPLTSPVALRRLARVGRMEK